MDSNLDHHFGSPTVPEAAILEITEYFQMVRAQTGGERGIRTLGTLSRTHAFQACALSRSAISPAAGSGQYQTARRAQTLNATCGIRWPGMSAPADSASRCSRDIF